MRSPVLFLLFNRPDLSRRVFASIRAARPAELFIAVDGPREQRPGEKVLVEECREIAKAVDWPCRVETLFRERNLGCGQAVSTAISWFFDQVDEGIILEDDCLPHPAFFEFCDVCLETFRDEEKVGHVGGDLSLRFGRDGPGGCFFSRYAPVWGWATWRRAWCHYDLSLADWDAGGISGEEVRNYLGDRHVAAFWSETFDKVKRGEIDTWDYQWIYRGFLRRSLSVMPPVNLISNIGFDARGTHTRDAENRRANFPVQGLRFPLQFPGRIEADDRMDRLFDNQYFGIPKSRLLRHCRDAFGLARRVKRKLKGGWR